MLRQTIRTFFEVKDGIVQVGRTDPILTPLTVKDKESRKRGDRDAESGIESRTEEETQGQGFSRMD